MAQLSENDKSRCRVHLGYMSGRGIPAGDRAMLEEAMNDFPDDYTIRFVQKQLDRCEAIYNLTDPSNEDAWVLLESYAGDVNRTKQIQSPKDAMKLWWNIYLGQTDQLAFMVRAPNYWQPEVQAYAFAQWGGEYIMSVPGPADTCVGTRLYLARRMA